MQRAFVPAVLLAAYLISAPSQANTYADTGKAVAYAMPVAAAGIAVYHKDWKGLAQLTFVTGLTYGAAYGLKQVVRSRRPYQSHFDHSTGWDSFPSTTAAIASAPSSFVWRRYGWEWGLPMFVVSKYPSYALQKSHQNKIWDGLGSTALAWGLNAVFTPRYKKPGLYDYQERGFYSDFEGQGDGMFATVGFRW